MNENCTHETSIVLQDCNGFSILQCTWACGLQLIELHLDNHEVKTFTAQDLARLQRIEQAAKNLQTRLDEHFGGFVDESDWKEQAELRAALKS